MSQKSSAWESFKAESGINARLASVRESDMSAIAIMRRGQPVLNEREERKRLKQFHYDRKRKK